MYPVAKNDLPVLSANPLRVLHIVSTPIIMMWEVFPHFPIRVSGEPTLTVGDVTVTMPAEIPKGNLATCTLRLS
jgi:hypothetical protein